SSLTWCNRIKTTCNVGLALRTGSTLNSSLITWRNDVGRRDKWVRDAICCKRGTDSTFPGSCHQTRSRYFTVKACSVDSEEGDTMATSTMGRRGNDRRDNTFVRYEMYVDRHANQRRRKPEYELKTCYGQLEHIFCVTFHDAAASTTLGLKGDTVILAAIRGCVLTNKTIPGLNVHFYANLGALEVVDITTIQALVGRVPDGSHGWAIIDRSGNLARAIGAEDEDEEAGQ
ncbi:hypothetical protein BKA70DRAFT_1245317, partial [Coprinopsis sp. MPI-PUGE-AT-0042]